MISVADDDEGKVLFGCLLAHYAPSQTTGAYTHVQPEPQAMASVFSRMFGGGRRWNAFNEPGSGNGSDLGTGAAGGQAGPTAGAVAPSATAAASPLDYAPLPRERIAGLRSLFTWNGWMVRWGDVSC